MARSPNVWLDPRTGRTYAWPVNHHTEDAVGKSRQMSDGAATDNIGLIPQQGAATPLILNWKGRIFTKAMLQEFLTWWELCETQTIYLTTFSGAQYEVLITNFDPQTIAVAQNRHDLAHAPTNVWDYTLTMRVLRAISGEWHGVKP